MGKHITEPRVAIPILALLTLRALGCGGSDVNPGSDPALDSDLGSNADIQNGSTAPFLENLRVTTSPVIVGEQAYGSVLVTDPDGLDGLTLRLDFDGPSSGSTEGPIQEAGDETQADVPIDFVLMPGWPEGEYTLTSSVTDDMDLESNAVSTTIVLTASPGELGELAL